MKKLLFITLTLFLTCSAFADDWGRSKEIQPNQLPQVAQNILNKYFGGLSFVSDTRQWPNNYSVYVKSGQKLKFQFDGTLREAKAENNLLPKTILSELPNNVSSYINTKYSDWGLVEVEVKRSKIDIELEKGRLSVDIEFDRSGKLLNEDIDD
ncbi:MAG: PepSY-like domain-containing protein [Dysgonomonas sp.]|nr:PepSY-like domain-containing protein [Dysgonomonas sp.]